MAVCIKLLSGFRLNCMEESAKVFSTFDNFTAECMRALFRFPSLGSCATPPMQEPGLEVSKGGASGEFHLCHFLRPLVFAPIFCANFLRPPTDGLQKAGGSSSKLQPTCGTLGFS